MARHLPIPSNDSERESSADPLDLISPPRPEPLSLPPTSSSRPRSKRNSTAPSRSSSRSTSPSKSRGTSRGRGRGGGKTRGSTSTSRSPEKKVVRRVIHRSEPDAEEDEGDDNIEEEEREDRLGRMDSAVRKVKRRRIHSESEDDGDRPSATLSPRIDEKVEAMEEEEDKEEPSEILPALEGGQSTDGVEEVKIDAEGSSTERDNTTAEDNNLVDTTGKLEDDREDQEEKPPIQEDAVQEETIEQDNTVSSPAAHPNVIPSATIGPIPAADLSTETTSLAEQSGEYALEPKDMVTQDVEGVSKVDEEDDDILMADEAQENEHPFTSTQGAGDLVKDQSDADVSTEQPVISQIDSISTEEKPAIEQEVVEGIQREIDPSREVERSELARNSEEEAEPLEPEPTMGKDEKQSEMEDKKAAEAQTIEQMEEKPTEQRGATPQDVGREEAAVVVENNETLGEQPKEEKMEVDETPHLQADNVISSEEHGDESAVQGDQAAPLRTEETEGEVEIDPTSHTDEENVNGQAAGEMEVEPTTNEETLPTPAPSSPAKSIAASQASTSTTKPGKKPSTANNKKKAASTASKKSSTPISTGSASGSAKKGAGAVKGKGKTKVEELKGTSSSKPKSKSATSASSEPPLTPTTPTRPSSLSTNSPSLNPYQSPDKNAIYCVCRKPYSEEEDEVMMVGCESCDNWFHPGCVGLTEDMVEALDVYICKSCERSTHQRTIYKQLCKREGCSKSLAGSSSKFCSSSCAFQHSQSILSSMSNKNTLKQLAKTFIGYPQPRLGISTITHSEKPSISHGSKSDRLTELEKQLTNVNRSIEMVNKRQRILDQVILKAENAILAPNGNEQEEEEEIVYSKKGKKKKGGMSGNGVGKDDKPCGWDRVLIADDEEVARYEVNLAEDEFKEENANGEDQREEGLCMRGKRRCDRHQGWQRTVAAQLEIELSGLERTQKNLMEYIDGLKSTSEVRSFTDEIRNGFLERKGLVQS